jgi:hypothetical protein
MSPFVAAVVVVALNVGYLALAVVPRFAAAPAMMRAVVVSGVGLLVVHGVLRVWARRRGRVLEARVVVRAPHSVQLCMQGTVYVFWAMHFDAVREHVPHLVAQVLFAYVLDALTSWARGRTWAFGLAPVPIVLSTNLFLWFRDEHFHWQLAMIALAWLSKAFIHWRRDEGQASTHVFNPSAFGLAVVSAVLVATRTWDTTWGEPIARTLGGAPFIYEVIFLVGLVVQVNFGVVLTTMSAAATLFLWDVAYTGGTGLYFFLETSIPASVFLGMNLLVSDPATSPRARWGKVAFGVLYGAAVALEFDALRAIDAPAYFDKLIQVPLLNLLVPAIDRVLPARRDDGRGRVWNLVHVGAWAALFLVMRPGLRKVDALDPVRWEEPCEQGAARACAALVGTYETGCARGVAEACVDAAVLTQAGRGTRARADVAASLTERACRLGDAASCGNLGVRYVEGDGVARDVGRAATLYEQACRGGQTRACRNVAFMYRAGEGVPRDGARAARGYERACELGDAEACVNLGLMVWTGDLVPADPARALALHETACRRGMAVACARAAQMAEAGRGGLAADPVRAIEMYQAACLLGDAQACAKLR